MDSSHKSIDGRNKSMTDEERIQLAAKLDAELDDFINSLEKRPYKDGWPEDNWEEEMEKHPFFMTKPPEEGEPLHPLLEGIQQLKYDDTENSPEELAATYKEDGNFHFKCKKYRVAVLSYTEGIKKKSMDQDLNAQLYNNRAAAQFFLKNYRSSLQDCLNAIKLKPNYQKAQSRAAECCFFLSNYDKCIELCDKVISSNPTDKHTLDLRAQAVSKKKIHDRDIRKASYMKKKEELAENALLTAIKERNIRIVIDGDEPLSLASLKLPGRFDSSVHLSDNKLIWPVMLLYPEYETSDFIQEFNEDCTFESQLATVFETPPEWDIDGVYNLSNINISYEDKIEEVKFSIRKESTLREILSDRRVIVRYGLPTFVVTVNSN